MTYLLAVDPSLTTTGVALFAGPLLRATHAVKVPRKGTILGRCVRIANDVHKWASQHAGEYDVAIEWPWIYPGHKNRTDPNQALMPLAALCGAICTSPRCDIVAAYKPREWTGGIPKATKKSETNVRASRIKSRLDQQELHVFETASTHDEIDAIGVGLYHLGRFRRLRAWHLE